MAKPIRFNGGAVKIKPAESANATATIAKVVGFSYQEQGSEEDISNMGDPEKVFDVVGVEGTVELEMHFDPDDQTGQELLQVRSEIELEVFPQYNEGAPSGHRGHGPRFVVTNRGSSSRNQGYWETTATLRGLLTWEAI